MDKMFCDRTEAGSVLAHVLRPLELTDPVVISLPGGGVPVAAQVARALSAPLDLLLVHEIGAPDEPSLAVAAVVDGRRPDIVLDDDAMSLSGATAEYVQELVPEALNDMARRRSRLLGSREFLPLEGRTAVLVDDGGTSHAVLRAALEALRQRGAARLVLAVPVAPADALADLLDGVDDFVCVDQSPSPPTIDSHYANFSPVSDDEVAATLEATA